MGIGCEDTIIAPATAAGVGLRAILRMTGPRSHELAAGVLASPAPAPDWSRRFAAEVSFVIADWGRTVEGALFSWPEGRSQTGQASVEFHLPAGAPLMVALQSQLHAGGARPARPGEFTLRAFLAGRLDLMQAEAVLGLVEAENLQELQAAVDQRTGGLSRHVAAARDALLDLLADVEAGLDFVEEDIQFVTPEDLTRRLKEIDDSLATLARDLGRRLFEADHPRVILVGEPNAGKSSLFNLLAGAPHALVSPEAGTTRDYLTALVPVGDRVIELIDTAGTDAARDEISRQAADLREREVRSAALRVRCVPVTTPASERRQEDSTILARTKCDLAPEFRDPAADCHVTVTRAEGARPLLDAIGARLDRLAVPAGAGAGVSERCRQSLDDAASAIRDALAVARAGGGPEVVAVAIREALAALGEIVGAVYTDDLLDRVFARFCIGK